MKNRNHIFRTTVLMSTWLSFITTMDGQLNNPGGAGWWRTDVAGANLVNGLAIGNATGPYASALMVQGGLMPTPTGEVFRTDAAAGVATSWRLLRGGTQIGRLYVNTTNNNFQIDASAGNLIFRTNDTRRAMIMQATTGATINSYGSITQTGYVGIGDFTNANVSSPFAYLHIDDGGTLDSGFRPWMRPGTLITHENDQGYFGLKDEDNGNNHTVIAWSDNDGGDNALDRLKFIFVANNNSANGVAGTLDGLEAARFVPDATGDQSFFGVGDWFTAGLDPDERVDVLDRTVRIRRLVPDYEDQELERFVVTDDDGRLHWRNIDNLPDNCEWTMSSSSPNHLYTATGGADASCPDDAESVGIGTSTLVSKLDIKNKPELTGKTTAVTIINNESPVNYSGLTTGLIVKNTGDDASVGIYSKASGGSTTPNDGPIGVLGWATATEPATSIDGLAGVADEGAGDASHVYAIKGLAFTKNNTTSTNCYGVYGSSTGESTNMYGVYGTCANTNAAASVGDWSIGVYGSATGGYDNGVTIHNWGGYFAGHAFCADVAWNGSDALFKTNIEDLEGGLDKIMQLQPRTYEFDVANYGFMGLGNGPRIGLVAQEVEPILPELVAQTSFPAQYDSLGNVVHAAVDFKAMNYTGLIPVLIAAVKEQQLQIQALQAEIDGCCSGMQQGGQHMSPMGGTDVNSMAITSGSDALKIQPNPFSDATTISYTLAEGGSVRLLVSTSSGKQLQVLEDVQRSAGNYTYEWNTTSLASGIYNVMLLLDGAPMMQKAVKIAR